MDYGQKNLREKLAQIAAMAAIDSARSALSQNDPALMQASFNELDLAATQDISRSIGSVAASYSGMSDQLAELVGGTRSTQEAVDVVKNELARLSDVACNMQVIVDRFKLADSSDTTPRS